MNNVKKGQRGEAFAGFVLLLAIGGIFTAASTYVHDKGELPPTYDEVMNVPERIDYPLSEEEHILLQMPEKSQVKEAPHVPVR